MKRIASLTAAAAVIAALAPATSGAATQVGADLNQGGSLPPNCGNCTLVHPNPAFGMVSPVDGVITKWRVRIDGPFDSTATLRVVEVVDSFNEIVKGVRTGNPQVLSQPDNTFTAQLPINAGQSIAVDTTGNPGIIKSVQALGAVERFLGGLADGETKANGGNIVDSNGQLALSATVEPDADGDGFGDESQDPCKGDAANACAAAKPGAQNAPLGLDRTAPKASAKFGKKFNLAKALKSGIKGKVTSNEAGKAVAQVERKVKKGKKTTTQVVGLGDVKIAKPGSSDLTLKFSKKTKKALRKLGKASLTVRITVRDDAGNPSVIATRTAIKK